MPYDCLAIDDCCHFTHRLEMQVDNLSQQYEVTSCKFFLSKGLSLWSILMFREKVSVAVFILDINSIMAYKVRLLSIFFALMKNAAGRWGKLYILSKYRYFMCMYQFKFVESFLKLNKLFCVLVTIEGRIKTWIF